jgi:hypothetical protein
LAAKRTERKRAMQTRRRAFVFAVALTILVLLTSCVPIQPPTPMPGAEATAIPAEEATAVPAEEAPAEAAAPVEFDPKKNSRSDPG